MLLLLFLSFITSSNGIVNDPERFSSQGRPESDYFLPDNILARRYELVITPYFTNEIQNPWFEGELNMTFTPVTPGTSFITLNAGEGLNINESSVQLVSGDGEVIFTSVTPIDREVQMFSIIADRELIPLLDYTLSISFQGIITNGGYGLFRGSYIEPDNVKRWYLGTQLRPVYARQMFPCLDEPKYKAAFALTVIHSQEFLARSNQPHIMVSGPDENGRRQTTFAETPLMSPYLLTLFVFQFISVNSETGSSFIHPRFKGWAVPSKINQMEFSQDICPKLVDIAENYFGSVLPVPKMDQIALPELVVIAMENWGINTYREINILADRTSPMRQRQTVGRFTGHEVLHHWIGDLVTLEWWDYLWAQEAFAMYFEYFFPNQMTPAWRMMDQFITDLTVEGLHGDNFNSPLTTRVVTPQEVTNKFAGLTYTKGPALIRMLEHAVGREILKKALSDLVERKKYLTMTPQDLWTSFQPYTTINVNRMMATWTDQGSYPILFVYREILTNTITIEQNSSDNYGGNTSQLWNIPISYTTKSERNFDITSPVEIMTRPVLRLRPNIVLSNEDWIILNLKFTGYYRVLYENDIIHLIVKQLLENHTVIHRLNRAQLIDDIFDFADKKITYYQLAFYLVSYVYKEREYVPLRVAFRAFRDVDARLQLTPIYDKFQTYMKLLLKLIYNDIGFDDKSHEQPLDKLNREQVVEWACYYDVEDCRVRSSVLFEKTIRDGLATSSLPADTRSTIMCYAAKYGSLNSQNYFINEINRRPTDKTTVEINSLACSPSDSLVYILNSQIPDHKWIDMFTAIIAREDNSLFAATYLTMNLDNIVARVGEDTAVGFIKQLQTKRSLQGISKNLALNLQNSSSNRKPKIMSALNDLLSAMRTNELWIKDHYKDIEDSLDQFTNTMRVAKYFMFRPINFFDSFRLTKALHSHLYSGL